MATGMGANPVLASGTTQLGCPSASPGIPQKIPPHVTWRAHPFGLFTFLFAVF
jgi:hypothetical protein